MAAQTDPMLALGAQLRPPQSQPTAPVAAQPDPQQGGDDPMLSLGAIHADIQDNEPWLDKIERFAGTPLPGAWDAMASSSTPGLATIGGIGSFLEHNLPQMQSLADNEVKSGNPYRAGIASFLVGALKSEHNVASSALSPMGLAAGAVGGASGAVAKSAQMLFGVYMTMRGTQTAMQGQLQNELLPDMVERRLMGAASAVGGLVATATPVKDGVRHFVRKGLGIDGNLANVVVDKVRNAEQMRSNTSVVAGMKNAELANSLSSIHQEADAKVSEISDNAAVDRAAVRTNAEEAAGSISKTADENMRLNQQRQQMLEEGRVARAKRIIADACQAVEMERARVSQPFKDIAEQHIDPVSDATSVRQTIVNAVEDFGVNAEEIPKRAFAAIGERGKGFDEITMNGVKGRMSDLPQSVQDSLRNSGALPDDSMRFGDLIRVKDDLYATMEVSQDGALRTGLGSAIEKIDGMLDEFAGKKGFAETWRKAKGEYSVFQRELNSPVMRDWLSANDIAEQALTPKIAKLTTSTDAEAIRTVLKRSGIDVSPLDRILRDLKTTNAALKAAPKMLEGALSDIFGSADKEIAGINKSADKQLSSIEKTRQQSVKGELDTHTAEIGGMQDAMNKRIGELNQDTMVPGTGDLDLSGVSDTQIKALRLQKTANAMKAMGISKPMNFMLTVMSLIRMMKYGALGYGGTLAGKMALPELLNSRAFQDWVIRDSGVEPTNKLLVFRVRQGLADLYPIARRLSASQSVVAHVGVESSALNIARERRGRRILPPSTEVAKSTY